MADAARKSKVVKIGDREFVLRELTVGQIRRHLDRWQDSPEITTLDMLFPERLPSDVVAAAAGMDAAALDALDLAPSEMEVLIEAAEAVNPTFASLVKRLAEAGRTHAAASTGPSAP